MNQLRLWLPVACFAASLPLCLPLASAQTPRDARNASQAHTRHEFRLAPPASRQTWEKRSAELKLQILTAAGLDPMPQRAPVRAIVVQQQSFDGVIVENLLLETFAGYYLGGNLYRPARGGGPLPGILTPHGHWKHGRLEDTEEYSGPALGFHLARLGFVAFAYDMVGYNDTMQLPHEFGKSASERLWSFTPFHWQTWNSIRALDYLAGRPEVDPSRLGATGASGGGTQTFLLAAVDERVRAAAPVNMVSAHFQGGCECENGPGLRWGTNNVEIVSLIAPRPLLLVAATGDWTCNTPTVEYPAVRSVYRLYGQAESVQYRQFEAKHNFNRESREAVYRFFRSVFYGDRSCAECRETPHPIREAKELRVLSGKESVGDALHPDTLRSMWQEAQRAQAYSATLEELRERLVRVAGLEWPREVRWSGHFLSRLERKDSVPARYWKRAKQEGLILVHPEGSEAALRWWEQHNRARESATVLALDVFQTGAAVAPRRAQPGGHYLTFHRTDDAERVQDILTGLRFLNQQGFGEIRLAGPGRAAMWCLYAAAVSPVRVRLESRLGAFHPSDGALESSLYIPGLQRVGGLAALLRLVREDGARGSDPGTLRPGGGRWQ